MLLMILIHIKKEKLVYLKARLRQIAVQEESTIFMFIQIMRIT